MSKKAKIAWLYVISALFVAISLYLLVNKNNYLFSTLCCPFKSINNRGISACAV